MKMTLALCLIAGFAGSAKADSFTRPESCVLVATAQDDHCAVQSYFSCTAAGPVRFRTEVSYGGGQVEVHNNDANHGGIAIQMPSGGARFEIKAKGDHPRVAMTTGSSRLTERATIISDGASRSATMIVNFTHEGEARKLGGEVFHRLTYTSTLTFSGTGGVLRTSGSMLFSDRLDLLINEVEVSDGQGGKSRRIKLKSLALEGQKGFGATKPKFGCG